MLVAAALTVAALAHALPASAGTVTTNCAQFQATLNAAGAGDTIVLDGLCFDQTFNLPATPNLTIEGAATGTNGFDGDGAGAPALSGTNTSGLTLRNLLFKNFNASAVSINTNVVSNPFTVVDDTFVNNNSPVASGGGLHLNVFSAGACPNPGPTINLSGSTFTSNSGPGGSGASGAEGGGGGAFLVLQCPTGGGTGTVTVTGNTFSGNSVVAPAAQGRQGGGLWIGASQGAGSIIPLTLVQSDNLFTGNSVTADSGDAAGGGEFTFGANLTTTGDRYLGNSLSASSGATLDREGGGLSTRTGGSCTLPSADQSVLTNLVAAGNTIAAPTGAGNAGEGAGVYAGCGVGTGNYNLTLASSTVAGNQASGAGAVAGVDGEATDVLHTVNSIIAGNTGGVDLDGFGATAGANVTAQNSDLCAIGSSAPFAGAGNICANPVLADGGNGDVNETASSPTIDAGDNGLVTTSTDVFGNPRTVPGRPGDAAIVDMGAAEFQLAPPPTGPSPSNVFTIAKLHGKTLLVMVNSPGTVVVTQTGAGGSSGALTAKKRKKKSGLLLRPSSASGGPGVIGVPLLLTKRGKKQQKAKGKVKVNTTVTFTPTGGSANSKPAHLTIRAKKKKKKKKKKR